MPSKPSALISVRVTPKSSSNRLEVDGEGSIRVWVTAPPVDDGANKAVCSHLAKVLSLPSSSVSVARGHRSRDKVIRADGHTDEAVASILVPGISIRF
jgi:uncharacterized protein YggU (UPF0235/DUF167 family)